MAPEQFCRVNANFNIQLMVISFKDDGNFVMLMVS